MLIALDLLCFSFDPCTYDLCFRVEGEEVLEFLGDKSKANEEDASLVIAQLVEALCYLHRQNVVHLDIRVRQMGKLLGVRRYQAKKRKEARKDVLKGEKRTRHLSVSGKASEKSWIGKWINTDHYLRNMK